MELCEEFGLMPMQSTCIRDTRAAQCGLHKAYSVVDCQLYAPVVGKIKPLRICFRSRRTIEDCQILSGETRQVVLLRPICESCGLDISCQAMIQI